MKGIIQNSCLAVDNASSNSTTCS